MRTRPTLELALRDLAPRPEAAETTVSTGRTGCQREVYRRKNDCRTLDSRPVQEKSDSAAINLKWRLSVVGPRLQTPCNRAVRDPQIDIGRSTRRGVRQHLRGGAPFRIQVRSPAKVELWSVLQRRR